MPYFSPEKTKFSDRMLQGINVEGNYSAAPMKTYPVFYVASAKVKH